MLPSIDTKPEKHILKPWWDVLTDYISLFLMIIPMFGIYLQITRDNMTCLPCKWVDNNQCKTFPHTNTTTDFQNEGIFSWENYASPFCYEATLHWFAKYAPYVLFFHTLIFMACSKFLFTIPCTSSNLDKFVSILLECVDSPWTTKALSETVVAESGPTSSENMTVLMNDEVGVNWHHRTTSKIATKILGKKDGEKAKALFEKVKKFRVKVEKGKVIYFVYISQTIIKIVNVVLVIIYPVINLRFIDFDVVCFLNVVGYNTLSCINTLAKPYGILVVAYIILGVMYGLSCIYTLIWMCTRSLKTYSFESIREESCYSDIPDMVNDFAFMLHLTDQYDSLYTERFAVFLSEASEKRLRQVNLDNEWKLERLSQHITKNSKGRLGLQLFKLSGIPNTVFELKELEVLKLVLSPDLIIPSKISQLSNLTEMWLCHTPAEIDVQALDFLSENLRTLHVTFIDNKEIPRWICSLKNLSELHLTGNLGSAEFRDLNMLKVLYLKNNLTTLPQAVINMGEHLYRLCIQNNGTKLENVSSLKKMVNLMWLELVACNLDPIPSSIASLHKLQELDLKDNNLTSIEAIVSFQSLKYLVCLKLWHNNIAHIPVQIGTLVRLQRLYLNNNKIEEMSQSLFCCQNLRLLDLSHNKLTSIDANIGDLKHLRHFAVTANMIETLPPELFKCKKLHTLNLGNNLLETLPSSISELTALCKLELRENLLSSLPVELGECHLLKRSGLVVENNLFDTLETSVKEQFLNRCAAH
ncbi:volume-regulated anion channel subunit LRRC8A [Solea senegalensis]|uniref:Volume-regulated anion channel subunit LRRC8A n=1 Tax=Solea senegalensis TaxID=28829 RepID=A0AAV6QVF0_SOLSE|nr:volume-regulated anion channel subunit LRRC8A-like [Solea senegalensis]KAG7496006.1 volume-regulated anion channel subunit LRRC8A [Solea senegalensis]